MRINGLDYPSWFSEQEIEIFQCVMIQKSNMNMTKQIKNIGLFKQKGRKMSTENFNNQYQKLAAELGDTIYKISLLEQRVHELHELIDELNSAASYFNRAKQKPLEQQSPTVSPLRPVPQTEPGDGQKN